MVLETTSPFPLSPELPGEQQNGVLPAFVDREGERIEVPAILLQTEHPPDPVGSGDERLQVTARDPNWLYVHWNFTREQQAKLNAESTHGHMILRIYTADGNSSPANEYHVHPQSRHWFVPVESAGIPCYVELGRYLGDDWRRVAIAGPVATPHRRVATDLSATFLTLHLDQPLQEQLDVLREPEVTGAASAVPSGDSEGSVDPQFAVLRALGLIPSPGGMDWSQAETPGSGGAFGRTELPLDSETNWFDSGSSSESSPFSWVVSGHLTS